MKDVRMFDKEDLKKIHGKINMVVSWLQEYGEAGAEADPLQLKNAIFTLQDLNRDFNTDEYK